MKRLEEIFGDFRGLTRNSQGIARGAIGMPRCARHDRILASLGESRRLGLDGSSAQGIFISPTLASKSRTRNLGHRAK